MVTVVSNVTRIPEFNQYFFLVFDPFLIEIKDQTHCKHNVTKVLVYPVMTTAFSAPRN